MQRQRGELVPLQVQQILALDFAPLLSCPIFSRFDKLDVMFLAFLHFALIVEALR